MLGYFEGVHAYRLFDPESKRITIARDVNLFRRFVNQTMI